MSKIANRSILVEFPSTRCVVVTRPVHVPESTTCYIVSPRVPSHTRIKTRACCLMIDHTITSSPWSTSLLSRNQSLLESLKERTRSGVVVAHPTTISQSHTRHAYVAFLAPPLLMRVYVHAEATFRHSAQTSNTDHPPSPVPKNS